MPASMSGVSISNQESCFDDLFPLHHGTIHSLWPPVTPRTRLEACGRFSFGSMWQPYAQDVFWPHQPALSPMSSSSFVEDEDTRHGFVSPVSGSASTPSRELSLTFSTFNNTIESGNTGIAADQAHVRAQNSAPGFAAHQLTSSFQNLQVNCHNQLRAEISSSSFNLCDEYGRYSVHPMATHQRSMERSTVSSMTDSSDSIESEQPTDLSMPKSTSQNVSNVSTEEDNSCKNDDASQETYYGRNEYIRRLTYTHLSDVSNDSEGDSDGKQRTPKTFTRGFARKQFEKVVPYQLALPWKSTDPVYERPEISMLDPLTSYTQMVVDQSVPQAFSSYIRWLLEPQFIDRINKVPDKVANQKQKIVELEESNFHEHSETARNRGSLANEHIQSDAEEYEVIDLTQDDDEEENRTASDQLHVQPPTMDPPPDQQLLTKEPSGELTVEQRQYTLCSPHLNANTLIRPRPISPVLMLPVDSIMPSQEEPTVWHSLAQPLSPRNSSAQQDYYCSPPMLKENSDFLRDKYMTQNLLDASPSQLLSPISTPISNRKKRPYKELEPVDETTQYSGRLHPRRSPRLQSMASEYGCSSAKRSRRPQNQQDRWKPNHTDKKAQTVAQSLPQRSSRFTAEARKRAETTEKKSREPWNHKGLMHFVAQNACNLPRHVWTERKEGEPRRSMRLAKKMQHRKYFLRPRLHTKS